MQLVTSVTVPKAVYNGGNPATIRIFQLHPDKGDSPFTPTDRRYIYDIDWHGATVSDYMANSKTGLPFENVIDAMLSAMIYACPSEHLPLITKGAFAPIEYFPAELELA